MPGGWFPTRGVGSQTSVSPVSLLGRFVSERGDQGPPQDTQEKQQHNRTGNEKTKPTSTSQFAKNGFHADMVPPLPSPLFLFLVACVLNGGTKGHHRTHRRNSRTTGQATKKTKPTSTSQFEKNGFHADMVPPLPSPLFLFLVACVLNGGASAQPLCKRLVFEFTNPAALKTKWPEPETKKPRWR